MEKVKAEWTGAWPCLCNGEWKLIVEGKDVSHLIPEDLKKYPMKTYGTYTSWHFENWQEVFEDYIDGMMCEQWIKKNKSWLRKISKDPEIHIEIYNQIQANDWRPGSCGGCI